MRGGRGSLGAAVLWPHPVLQLRALRALPAAPPGPGHGAGPEPKHGAGPGQRRELAVRDRGALGWGRFRNPGCCAGSAGAESGAAMAEPGERRSRAGTSGATAAGSEGEEANPGEEEDEEVWEDGDSGHQRLGKAQLQPRGSSDQQGGRVSVQ
ncbi:uncharacterized protein GJ701_005958 isoform 4-T5 [Geothlypis trichas]